MALVGKDDWEVTAAAPRWFEGDFGPILLEPMEGERSRLIGVSALGSKHIHLFAYGAELSALMKSGFDLVHAWEEPYIVAGGQIAHLCPERARLVFATFQNLDKNHPIPFKWIERYCLERAAGFVAFGQTITDTLTQKAIYRARPHRVIPLGVDLEHFRPDCARGAAVRLELGFSDPGPPVVGFLGRFVEEKGVALLMSALEEIATPWRALFVGSGPLAPVLQKWAARFSDRVRIASAVPHAEVPRYLNAMDLLCAPSQTTPRWREQLGRMLLEGFASGVPIIASDSGEIPNVMGDAGVIVGEKDHAAWRAQIERMIGDSAARVEWAKRGRARAEDLFAWSTVARRHLQFFQELCDARR